MLYVSQALQKRHNVQSDALSQDVENGCKNSGTFLSLFFLFGCLIECIITQHGRIIFMKHFEIERRFVLYPCSMKRFLKTHGISHRCVQIIQFYLITQKDKVVRYRRQGNIYIRTVKHGGGMVREESEEIITKDIFEDAFRRNRGGVIRKKRFVFEVNGNRFELDSFKKPFLGLNILEVEFGSEKEARSFTLPQIFKNILIDEITCNHAFANSELSKQKRIPPIQTPLENLLEQVDARKDFFKASLNIEFTPYESSAHTIKTLVYSLLKTIEANRKAILAGKDDPEHLHQLRVAMRKIRAIFSQMKRLFDPVWLQEHKERVASLMRKTGHLRDIDVYLLNMDNYKTMLPVELHTGLHRFEVYLLGRQHEEREKIERFLSGDIFLQEFEELMRFAKSSLAEGFCDEAFSPVIVDVKAALSARYEKILKKGGKILDSSAAHEYHMVRIEVKKLRYLMEFYSSILDKEAYMKMVGRLKKIQTVLGEHQDLDFQREHLKVFMTLDEMHNETTLESLRLLREKIYLLEIKKRAKFRKEFTEFVLTGPLFKRMVCKF